MDEFTIKKYREERKAAKSAYVDLFSGFGHVDTMDNYSLLGWAYAALKRRQGYLARVPYVWLDANDNEVVEEDLPFTYGVSSKLTKNPADDRVLRTAKYLKRELIGKDLYGLGSWYKHYGAPEGEEVPDFNRLTKPNDMGSSRVMSLAHLDPRFLYSSEKQDGYIGEVPTHYSYANSNSASIPTWRMIRFLDDGFSEYRPFIPPAIASELASLLLGKIDELGIGVATDPYPAVGIEVPEGTTPDSKRDAARQLEGIFNSVRQLFTKGIARLPFKKVFNLQPGTTLHTVSKLPEHMSAYTELSDPKMREITSVFGVPVEILTGESSSLASRRVNEAALLYDMAFEFDDMADAINMDPDIKALGYRLVVQFEKLPLPPEERLATANIYQIYRDKGHSVEASLFFAGVNVNDLPADLDLSITEPDNFFTEATLSYMKEHLPPQYLNGNLYGTSEEQQIALETIPLYLEQE